jgi:hypothetical protein
MPAVKAPWPRSLPPAGDALFLRDVVTGASPASGLLLRQGAVHGLGVHGIIENLLPGVQPKSLMAP